MNRMLAPILCAVALAGCSGGDEKDTAVPVAPACDERPIELPTPRGEVGGAWDPVNDRMVLFGGDHGVPVSCAPQTDFVGDTWAFQPDCDNFVELKPADAPKRRGRHATAADATRMIVHGGRSRQGTSGDYDVYDDTWSFDFATDTWSELDAPGGPSARSNHVSVIVGSKLYIYGGNASDDGLAFTPLGDTWMLDLDTLAWTELTTSNTPPDRLFHAGATDGAFLYVYAGGDENAFFGPFFDDLWALDLASLEWTELSDGAEGPEGRIWPALAHDAALGRLVMFGGHDDQELGNHNELWAFDLGTKAWDRVHKGDTANAPANGQCDFPEDFTNIDLESPERRNGFAYALSPAGDLYVFGGKTDCGLINDMWALTGDTWTSRVRATAGESCQRAYEDCSSLCF